MPAPDPQAATLPAMARSGAVTGHGGGGRWPVLLAMAGAVCISTSAILIALSAASFTAAAAWRCLFALPLLVPLAVAERRRLGSRSRRARLGAAASGLLLAADLVLWNHAIAAVGAGVATVLANLQVLFVAVIAWLLLGERPSRPYLAALPVVLSGVVLVAGVAGHPPGGHPLAGIGYGVTGSLAYGGFLLGLRQSSAGLPHVAGPLADTTAGAALGCLLIGLAAGGLWPLPGWASLGWLLLLAVTSQTLGWLAITASLPRLPAALSALLLLLQPVASLVLAAVILGQIPDPLQDLGAVLVCGGVLAASWPGRRRAGA